MLANLNIRPYNNKELLLIPVSIDNLLPKDYVAHSVGEIDFNWIVLQLNLTF